MLRIAHALAGRWMTWQGHDSVCAVFVSKARIVIWAFFCSCALAQMVCVKVPDAWGRALAGWKEVGARFADEGGIVSISGRMRFIVASKP